MTEAENMIRLEIKRRNPNKSLRLSEYPRRVLRAAQTKLPGSKLTDEGTVLVHEGERWTVETSKPGGSVEAWPKKI